LADVEARAAATARGTQSAAPPASGTAQENSLRAAFTSASAPYIGMRDALAKIEAGAKTPSSAGDTGMIFNYIKMLDPTSTVSPGEQATISQGGTAGERLVGEYNRLIAGGTLAQSRRDDIASAARRLFATGQTSHRKLVTEYRRLADNTGANPNNVIVDYTVEAPASVPIPLSGANAGRGAIMLDPEAQAAFDKYLGKP
jgi:hypothetical protein